MTETMQTPQREENSRFTPEQLAAIRSDGKTIVSASAGSGKTTVMIEKIIRFIVGGGKVSEVLAMTYTKKAAASMKEKLRKALIETINAVGTDKPRKQELKKQLDEVQNADISTIHSFCARLIRSNFYAAGVENDFRIIADDDAEGTALRNAALDELFEDGYENKDEGFAYLLSLYWRNKNDNALREIVLKTYSGVRTRADYKAYLQRSGEYTERTFNAICDDLYALLCEKCSYYRKRLDLISDYFYENGTPGMQKLCRQLEDMFLGILGAGGYYAAQGLSFEKLSTVSTNKAYSPERNALVNKLKALRAKATEIVGELQQIRPRERELADFLQSARTAREIGKCVLRFDEIYARKKNERNILDYGDLEHKALALLSIPEIVAAMRERYRYVFVDEYQDVNPVQEDLVKAIGGENVFLVGDVKQAIYGFRGSKSCYFLQKEKEYGETDGNSLKMKFNFRSADAVLDAVNEQFERAMTEETIGVDYQKDATMEKGGRYENGDGRVLLHVLEKPKNKTDEPMEKPSDDRGVYSVKAHAGIKTNTYSETTKLVRDIIEQELKKTWYDPDTKHYRQVRYGDIAILSRTLKGDVPNMIAALSDGGIPVTSSAAVNICQYGEIKTLIDILSYIDNEQQDIPLCSALLSGMGEITLDELAQIRITYPQKTERYFWSACKRYASEQADKLAQKLLRFYQRSAEYKRLSCVLDAGELLSVILTDTRMEARLLAKDNGTACLRRIHRFIEETYAEEPLSVHAFLERLDALEHKIKFSENGGEDSVQVMTMHSSKGLEFPVVIVIGLSDAFAGKESDAVLIEEDYGLAPRAFDDKNMQTTPTLLRELYDRKKAQSSIADELNLYYVALTRAKYALHMVFKKQSIMQDVRYARSMADFTDFAVWEKYKTEDSVLDLPKPPRQTLVFDPDQGLAQEIISAFLWKYPYTGGENLPVKSSATQLMRTLMEEENVLAQEKTDVGFGKVTELDALSAEEYPYAQGETGTERGVAYHAFLERMDMSLLHDETGAPVSRARLAEIIEQTLLNAQKAGEEWLPLVDKDKLLEILSNDVFYRLRGFSLYKEQQFLVSLPVDDTFFQDGKGIGAAEEILFQGAIDLLAVKGDKAFIVDYKYSVKSAEKLREDYRAQLNLYKLACAKILSIPLKNIRCTIVNIYRGLEVDMD